MKPSIGRIVHFVDSGYHYAAIITRVYSETIVDVTVFVPPHSPQTGVEAVRPVVQIAGVFFSASGETGTWHWPEREEDA